MRDLGVAEWKARFYYGAVRINTVFLKRVRKSHGNFGSEKEWRFHSPELLEVSGTGELPQACRPKQYATKRMIRNLDISYEHGSEIFRDYYTDVPYFNPFLNDDQGPSEEARELWREYLQTRIAALSPIFSSDSEWAMIFADRECRNALADYELAPDNSNLKWYASFEAFERSAKQSACFSLPRSVAIAKLASLSHA